jgi:protein SCO1/2
MRALLTLCLLGGLAFAGGCKGSESARPDPAVATTASAADDHAILPPTDVVPGRSIYALDELLVGHDGKATKLDTFRGHPVVISMFYATCPHACPTLISHVKAIEAKLDPAVRADVRILLVSFDPQNDTPEVLRSVIARHQLDGSRWQLAVATEDQSREIAAVLGIKYRQEDGSFRHSSVITVLDREGRIVLRSDGLASPSAVVAAKLAELAK